MPARSTRQATGVLAVALGEATKTVPYITDALKCYRFTRPLRRRDHDRRCRGRGDRHLGPAPHGRRRSSAALPAFRGEIMQVPPQFSAVKVDGERAYDLAREGEAIELAARPLWVERLELTGRPDADHAELEMVCGKGGYVRAIARDLGAALGCLGHVAWLRREWSGPFEAEDGVTLDEIERLARTPDDRRAACCRWKSGWPICPNCRATPEGAARLRNGNPGMVIAEGVEYGDEAWASYQGRAVAVGIYRAGELHPAGSSTCPRRRRADRPCLARGWLFGLDRPTGERQAMAVSARKRIWGWYFFDWASQPYNTLLLTFIFAPYFGEVARAHFAALGMGAEAAGASAQAYWGTGLTIAGVLIAVLAPILGAIADQSGRRMVWIWFFSACYVTGAWGLWFLSAGGGRAVLAGRLLRARADRDGIRDDLHQCAAARARQP